MVMRRCLTIFIVAFIATPLFCADDPEKILRSSLDLLGHTKNIRLHAVVTNDDVISTGQKLQRSMDLRITIRRSDALRVEMNGDRYRRNILYDGKVLTVSDPEQKFYATFDSPPTIDATIAAVREKLGLDLPLGVLFADNAYEALSKNARVATYVGLHRLSGASMPGKMRVGRTFAY